jgi:hypothetical protein
MTLIQTCSTQNRGFSSTFLALEKRLEENLETKLDTKLGVLEARLDVKFTSVVETLKTYTDASIARLDEKMQYYFTNLVQEIRRDNSKTKTTLTDHEKRISALESEVK